MLTFYLLLMTLSILLTRILSISRQFLQTALELSVFEKEAVVLQYEQIEGMTTRFSAIGIKSISFLSSRRPMTQKYRSFTPSLIVWTSSSRRPLVTIKTV